MECIDKNGKVLVAEFSEPEKNGSILCRVYNPEDKTYVDTFRIKASELGWESKEMIAQKRTYSKVYAA